ncbi:thiamine phosphate synthase [soil metagenome]
MPKITRPLLIAITDRRLFRMQPADWAREAIAGGVDLIQVREKDLSESELLQFAPQILEGTHPNDSRGSDPGLKTEEPFQGSRVQINGSWGIARLFDCGLHLPESEPVPSRPPHPLSRSIHSLESALTSTGVDFLIAGHIFATPSKSESAPRGLDWLSSIADAVTIPVVAIGGITSENAASCVEHGASGVAVISAIAASDDPQKSASTLRQELDRAWERKDG